MDSCIHLLLFLLESKYKFIPGISCLGFVQLALVGKNISDRLAIQKFKLGISGSVEKFTSNIFEVNF